jgi:hypothetical protein
VVEAFPKGIEAIEDVARCDYPHNLVHLIRSLAGQKKREHGGRHVYLCVLIRRLRMHVTERASGDGPQRWLHSTA